ncbi:hypothetical protein RB195_007921 [Necator americanus]|uniref:Uncharacterized protein n=1 Tax=Necator americanus TaxID=51031 RepID=A0ABR1C1Y1_NECAM
MKLVRSCVRGFYRDASEERSGWECDSWSDAFKIVVPYTSLSLLPIHYLSLLLSCLHEEGPHCYAGTQPRYTRNICTS